MKGENQRSYDEKTAQELYEIIKNDDLKSFSSHVENFSCGRFRFGRFPVLSVMYLYNSRKILSVYEETFLKNNSWQEIYEPPVLTADFRKKAGKCMRIYLEEVVSPAEMLLILDKTSKFKKLFHLFRPSPAVKQRLKDIYSIKYSLEINYVGESVILDRRPLTRTEKKRLLISVISAVLCVAIIVGTPFIVNAFYPFMGVEKDFNTETPDLPVVQPPEPQPTGKQYLTVTELSEINFSSNNVYTLNEDIALPEDFRVDRMTCELHGNGKKLSVKKGTPFGEVVNNIDNLIIESDGSAPIFEVIYPEMTVKDLTVNVDADTTVNDHFSFVAHTNYGTLQNVTLNLKGKLTVTEPSADKGENYYPFIGGLVMLNTSYHSILYGNIENCAVNYDNFTLSGIPKANATFGGLVAVNNANVEGCTVSGKITSDTVDLAGICSENDYVISNTANNAEITQRTEIDGWHPVISGIAITNNSRIISCENYGKLNCSSTYEKCSVSVGGIANVNQGYILRSQNSGEITAQGQSEVDVGGIAVTSYSQIAYCLSDGKISANGENCYVGGIIAVSRVAQNSSGFIYTASTSGCIFGGEISVKTTGEDFSAVGGIVGYVPEVKLTYDEEDNYTFIAGITTNCFSVGQLSAEKSHIGAIVGECGKNIHNENSYILYGVKYTVLNENAMDEALKLSGVGATVSYDEEGNKISYSDSNTGTKSYSIETIKANETYKAVMELFDAEEQPKENQTESGTL